jgi:voltage-gated potassium channel Kch
MKDNNNKIDVFVFIFTVEFYIVIALAKELMIYESYRLFFILSNVTVMFKLLRFFRLTKVYTELQILLLAISASTKELILLLVTFGIFAIVFGNLIYYTELTEPDTFHDIFIGIWWAVVTMTTVGYGDVVPKSPAGYITGVITSMSGLLIIAMPVAIIARNFDGYYNVHYDRILKRQTNSNINRHKVFHDVKTLPVGDIFEQDIDDKF